MPASRALLAGPVAAAGGQARQPGAPLPSGRQPAASHPSTRCSAPGMQRSTGAAPQMADSIAAQPLLTATAAAATTTAAAGPTTAVEALEDALAAAQPVAPTLNQTADGVREAVPLPASHPVALVACQTLPAQATLAAALQELRAAVKEVPKQAGAYASGLVRLEVPLPWGTRALWWLRGQAGAPAVLHPRIYFSPRRTTAADTEGSAAAGAAGAGVASVAGAGAAWLWRGEPGETLGEAVMQDMQRFLAAASPRIRAFGGARFNAAQQPAAEWQEFGSYCFMIPRVEFLEASGCNILACTVAWDASHATVGTHRSSGATVAAVGFASVEAAVMDAVVALDAVQAPAAPAAGIFKLQRHGARQVPDAAGWHCLMDSTHAELDATAAAAAAAPQQAAAAAQPPMGSTQLDACTPLLRVNPEAAREEYLLNGQEGLDDLLAALEGGFEAAMSPPDCGLTKVVLARRTDISITGALDPLALLEALQERDPRAYQLMLQMTSGATFLGSTPECLYTRTGSAVASEAVAGTRARGPGGDVEKDFWLAFDLLRSHKDHVEFTVVRDWVQQALAGVCEQVQVDVAKSVLKQGAVQHLYGKLSAQLKSGSSDAHLLMALHPTPAVCGRPRIDALSFLAAAEPFDRGFYAGPFGWISQEAAEFVVAIRSALVQPPGAASVATAAVTGPEGEAAVAEGLQQRLASHAAAGPGPLSLAAAAGTGAAAVAPTKSSSNGSSASTATSHAGSPEASPLGPADGTLVSLFAGVGIVRGSDTAQEWAELDLKVRQYERLLQGVPPLTQAPNINALWARLLVEELCRLGCNTFCVAPGSRSSPLTVAVAQHPRARVVPCIDERSLGFWALGYGRATGRPAVVITSSGTAVANLLPAAVEAAQSGVPLLLVTGDRPAELRDTGANQTIDQVKMFGGYARWHVDLPAPVDAVPARSVLSTVDTAVAAAMRAPAGPVHLNCQFREPLAPVEAGAWDRQCLQGLQTWEAGDAPLTIAAALQPAAPAVGSAVGALLAADPAAQPALRTLLGARRGLIVAAELTCPEDVVAASQLAQLLGWPVVADILSGLRAGVPAAGGPAGTAGPCPAVVHHFDHLLLLDRQQWQELRPDVVLQLGGHLTSKRINQFLEWCCLDGGGGGVDAASRGGSDSSSSSSSSSAAPLQWVLADRSPKRHDQFALLTHRLQAPLPALVAALAAQQQQLAAAAATDPAHQQRAEEQRRYCRLLQLLDAEASAAVEAALARMPELTEPQVARTLSQQLPPGEGLFVGNSMPIRDLDMYAAPAPPPAAATAATAAAVGSASTSSGSGSGAAETGTEAAAVPPPAPQGVVAQGLGAPVAANRGASGIDGVLSTAAGFADGLGRGTTLVVGDLSFLHDINGLNLLRSGEARPPLTVVLVNNSGGGIFSFLPIADALPEDVFTPLWATPQHVDLEGMCRAHGIPHQKVTAVDDLPAALRSAWGCNRHSVVEVVTSRTSNVQRHREIQQEVKQAVARTLHLLQRPPAALAPAALAPGWPTAAGAAAACNTALPPFELAVQAASYHAYSLPLARPLTTTSMAGGEEQQRRRGFLLHLSLAGPSGSGMTAHGVGEVAPLAGLHRETLQEAEQQLALLCQLLADTGSCSTPISSSSTSSTSVEGVRVPLTAALLGGRLAHWLHRGLGMAPESLLPSVRCGLETALLSAVAQYQGIPLAQLLSSSLAPPAASAAAASECAAAVNGLLDCQGSPEEAAAEAAALLQQQPYAALKIKVGRRSDPLEDAAAVLAIRAAVGPGVVLRADANRRWTLEQAVQFGNAVAGAQLQYVEEPVCLPADLAELHRRTGLALALDESVDEGLVGPAAPDAEALCEGVVALVLKPSVLGGYERAVELACWAQQQGMHAVVSSSFESCLGVAQLAQLAVALDASAPAGGSSSSSMDGDGGSSAGVAATHHGLATLSWFVQGLLPAAAAAQQQLMAPQPAGGGMGISVAAAQALESGSVALALGLDRHHQQQQQEEQQRQQQQHAAASVVPQQQRQRQCRRHCHVATSSGSYEFSLLEALPASSSSSSSSNGAAAFAAAAASPAPPVLFLHGFLGAADDWQPLMQALSLERRCVAVDLPGHGGTLVEAASSNNGASGGAHSARTNGAGTNGAHGPGHGNNGSGSGSMPPQAYSLEAAAAAVAALVQQEGLQGCQLVGYSLGARLALLLAARWPHLFAGVVSVSGTPGLPDPAARAERAARDDALAAGLQQGGLPRFLEQWYQLPMWAQLRSSPRFAGMLRQRQASGDARQLAASLAAASPGRVPSVWGELVQAAADGALPPLLLVAGAEDRKFVRLARKLAAKLEPAGTQDGDGATAPPSQQQATAAGTGAAEAGTPGTRVALVPGCGHAVHIERPVELLALLQQFFRG